MTLPEMLWSNLPMWLAIGFVVFLLPQIQVNGVRQWQRFKAGLGCGLLTVLLLAGYAIWQFMSTPT